MRPSPRVVSKRFQSLMSVITIISQVFFLFGPAIPSIVEASDVPPVPTLSTDKPDYAPEETVTVSGTGFDAYSTILMKVTRPDDSVVTGDGTFAPWPTDYDTATVDNGNFQYNYVLDGVFGTYLVEALDSSDTVVASVTFTDAIGYDKSGYDKGAASWGTGNQSGYNENDWVQYQYSITGITGTVPNLNIIYDEQVANRIFIDGFSNFRFIVDAAYVTGNSVLANGTPRPPSSDISGWHAFTPLNINYTHSGSTCNTTDSLNTPSAEHCFRIDPSNATFQANNPLFPVSFSSGTHKITIFYEAHMAATFVWATGHEDQLDSCPSIYCAQAPAGAVPANTTFGTHIYDGWTTSAFTGAGGGGSNKHFNIADQSAGPQGAITLPIPAVTTPTGSITITKITSPTPAVGQTFGFTGDFGAFNLDTDGGTGTPNTITFGTLPAATFNVTESTIPANWSLTNLLCTNSTGASTFSYNGATATINLAQGGVVTCTYTNTRNHGTSTVTTELHKADHSIVSVGGSVPLGTIMHDQATVTVTPNFGSPTGNIDFRFYTSLQACTDDTTFSAGTTMGSIALNGANPGVAHPSTATDALAAGTYAFKAKWAGDSTYDGNTSSCENFTVNQGTTSVTTELHKADHSVVAVGGHVDLGTIMHDKATVTVSGSFDPSGNVSFTFYNNNNCSGQGTPFGTVALSGNPGVAHPSDSTGALGAGDYSFKASWPGDTNYPTGDSSCENFTVDQAQLTVDTKVHDADHNDITNNSVELGSIVHDTAKTTGGVGGFSVPATTFTFYSNNVCDGVGTAVTNIGADESDATAVRSAASVALGAGDYSYKGSVPGNTNYLGDTSGCEPFTVNKAQLTVTTEVHDWAHVNKTNDNVPLGSVMHDTASVSGGVGGFAVPTPTFTLTSNYSDDCSQGSPVTNDGTDFVNGDTKSSDSAALAAGTYAYRGSVAGNDNYLGGDSDCEPFMVNKADLSISTQLHQNDETPVDVGSSVDLATTMHDQATVTGINVNFSPDNNVEFSFFENDECLDGTASGSVTLDGSGFAHPSDSQGPLAAGDYSFQASIANDDNYNGDASTCEYFTVSKADPDIVTAIHNEDHEMVTSVGLGTSVHDQATVTGIGVTGLEPTGNVEFTFFSNDSCEPDGTDAGIAALDGNDPGTADGSDPQGPLAAGSYSFLAHYVGDDNYKSANAACEPLTVNKADLGLVTEIHDVDENIVTSVPLGTTVHDQGNVSGIVAGFDPTANVDFTFYSNSSCLGEGTPAGSIAVVTGVAHPSDNEGPLEAGDYSFKASYPGDDNYNDTAADCEPLTVNQGKSAISTELHQDDETVVAVGDHVALGTIIHDSATVTVTPDSFTPTGSVSFTFFNNSDCSGQDGVAMGTILLDGSNPGVAHPSLSTDPLAAGDYSFMATWPGDDNYTDSVSACENFIVDKAQLEVTTEAHDSLHGDITNGSVDLGSIVHDTATVTGGVEGFPAPTPSFTMTSNYAEDCSQGDTVANDGIDSGNGAAKSADSTTLAAGDYAYRGEVADSDNYIGAVSDCEPFTVNKATPEVATEIHDANHGVVTSVALGTTVHDQASVTGIGVPGLEPSENVDFMFFNNDACEGEGTDSGSVALDGNDPGIADPSDDQGPLAAGSYSFQAHYIGDANYKDATGPCEPLTVEKADLSLATDIHDAAHAIVTSVPLGSTIHDEADISDIVGSFDPTEDVSFTFYTNDSCDGNGVSAGSAAVVAGVAHPSDSEGPLAADSYSFKASYPGDDNYNEVTAECEPLTVHQGTSSTLTELHENATESVIALGGESTTGNVHDKATVTVDPTFVDPTGNVTFRFYTTQAACAQDGNFSGGVLKGTVSLVAGVAHPSDATGALAAGNYAFKAMWPGDNNYTGSTSDCENFTVSTLTINKLANGGNDTFGYTVTGPSNSNPSVTTTGTPGTGSTTIVVLAGDYTVGETTIPSGWQLVGLNCAGVPEPGPTSSSFNIPVGTNRVCDFENTKGGATRTQGFWSTHTAFANDVWTNDVPASEKNVNLWGAGQCNTDKFIDADAITGDNELMGGFWANVAKKSNGVGRDNLDKARIVLLQQLLAAELNRYGLGTNDGGLIAAAKTAYCGTNLNAIKTSTGALDSFNQSGDAVPTGFSVPSATPKVSKTQADIPFWNNTTF